METRPFQPLYGPTRGPGAGTLLPSVTVAGITASAVASTPFPGSALNQFVQIRVANQSAGWAYVNFGLVTALTAATVATGMPFAPGSVEVCTVSPEVNAASVIMGVAGNVIFTRGEGM
jgi:hypothetical protein